MTIEIATPDNTPAQDGTVNPEVNDDDPKQPQEFSCKVSGKTWPDSTAFAEDYETIGDGAPR